MVKGKGLAVLDLMLAALQRPQCVQSMDTASVTPTSQGVLSVAQVELQPPGLQDLVQVVMQVVELVEVVEGLVGYVVLGRVPAVPEQMMDVPLRPLYVQSMATASVPPTHQVAQSVALALVVEEGVEEEDVMVAQQDVVP